MKIIINIGAAIFCALILLQPAQALEPGNSERGETIIIPTTVDTDANVDLGTDVDLGELRGMIDDQVEISSIEIDTIITGVPYKDLLKRQPSSSFDIDNSARDEPDIDFGSAVKFDSEGRPLAHHQEYPRPTAMSITLGLFDAIDLNPFPGN